MGNEHLIGRYSDHFSRPSTEVAGDLESYANLLRKWQSVQNLVSRETLDQVWHRHFVDSLQALTLTDSTDQLFLDLGSGGGFPALPLAIASKGTDRRFVLIEPTSRKVSFLRTVIRDLSLNAVVIGRRSDSVDSRETGVPDVITSRALAPLPLLFGMMQPFFGPHTKAILHKGREHVEELIEAGAHWESDVLTQPSDTDPLGVLLSVSSVRPRSVR